MNAFPFKGKKKTAIIPGHLLSDIGRPFRIKVALKLKNNIK